MREVIVAKSAGFCFGVKRAVEECYLQAGNGRKPIYTYGPIIHNEEVVEDLACQGVRVIRSREELSGIAEGTVIIRSHGVEKSVYDQITAQGLELVDATCPFVRKIHKIVGERTLRGDQVVIIGNADHPEVRGICGWAHGPVSVIETEEDAAAFRPDPSRSLCIVSQTTFHSKNFYKLVEIIKKMSYDSADVLDTICNATEERQSEAEMIAGKADAMIVIGGKHSSNTQKLFEICKEKCRSTFFIQTLVDLDIRLLPSSGCVGITAGASTPNYLIEEVSKHVRNEF